METRFTEQIGPTIETRGDGKPLLVGYAARYYDPTDPGTEYTLGKEPFTGRKIVERVMPGAFDVRNDVVALFNHDPNYPLGRTGAGTLRLMDDSKGLRYEIDPPDTDVGRRVVEAAKRGDLLGSSFGFRVEKQAYIEGKELVVRELRAVRLRDVGPVTFPAYAGATVGVRSEELCGVLTELAAAGREKRNRIAQLARAGLPTR